jgi:hypothetical protein
MSSFVSERTVEFYLVPRFKALLSAKYSYVLPFFYWKTREGNALSHSDEFPTRVTTCAMFPRRPKVHGEHLAMTVNSEVYLMSEHLAEAGIPTFLGFPDVEAFSRFADDFKCLWFSPNSKRREYTLHQIGPKNGVMEGTTLIGPFESERAIHEHIEANAKQQTWCTLLDLLFEAHSKISQDDMIRTRFRFGPPYKPVYFVMW